MLNEMIEAVKKAEEKAAEQIEEAKRAADNTMEDARRQTELMKAKMTDDAEGYSDGIKNGLRSEEEKLLREAEAKAESVAAMLRENAEKKQAEIDKILIDILFS